MSRGATAGEPAFADSSQCAPGGTLHQEPFPGFLILGRIPLHCSWVRSRRSVPERGHKRI